ncbi:hypothetical protein NDU88_009068 [Pleurodeles waltl]|uniref:Uncharacterized protein n=1 Tax=Pleurodeles waltl TaxID=8319 RepID=A0AAV7RWI2_PLEWA|nr:hypothetical protein NDU88_009068 [Pleurodeles waltl]
MPVHAKAHITEAAVGGVRSRVAEALPRGQANTRTVLWPPALKPLLIRDPATCWGCHGNGLLWGLKNVAWWIGGCDTT